VHVDTELRATLDQLEHRLAGLAGTAKELAQQLLAQRGALAESLHACISKPCTAVKSRYHGDYHLGQVLLTRNDFVIIDFEGEPSRPLIERRRKHSPLRDVAGMLLSFNYAAQTAMAHESVEQPESLARITPLLLDWEAEVGKVFLAAYAETVHEVGGFADNTAHCGLLDLFRLEKLFYEVRYELDNRPDWVVIPLRGIVNLINKRSI
jgi:maltose alpha-D-glucosyltransferase/alpha-amylase